MVKTLSVPKYFGTYADNFLVLGLAELAYTLQLAVNNTKEIKLADMGSNYQLQFRQEVDLDEVAHEFGYKEFLTPVKGNKTSPIAGLDWSDVDFFNTQENTERRNRWREYQRQRKREKVELADNDLPPQPHASTQNGVILTSMRHDRNHNALWKAEWDIQEHFGALCASILKAFSVENQRPDTDVFAEVANHFKGYTNEKLPSNASAVKIFMPTFVQGVNRPKADTNKVDSSGQKESWVLLWLIAAGLFEFGLSERIKVAEGVYDWRVIALSPKEINLFRYRAVLDELRKSNSPSGAFGVARFDAEIVLAFSKKLLAHHPAAEINKPVSRRSPRTSIRELVSGFRGTHFGSKGQVYGVKEIFSLGIPDWIRPGNAEDVKNYQTLLEEHLSIVRSLSADEGNSELLATYRDFITGNDLNHFFRFNQSYADYIVRQRADPNARFTPRQFSQEGLDIMTQSFNKFDQTWSVSDITQNQGFQRIARAINSATVYAGKIKTKAGVIELDWQRTYGLAQRLGNQAGSKKDFIAELTAFLTSYGNENLRLIEKLKDGETLKRVSVTNEDLEQFLALLDTFPCTLVANLLLAYGYCRWKKPLSDESKSTPIVEDDTSDENNLGDN